jgi:preprotein translocase subunit SecD
MVAIYRVCGLLAGFALVLYSFMIFSIFKFFGVVLTLAGIAGVILSIGLAIDANVLIFERMKEALREKQSLARATLI